MTDKISIRFFDDNEVRAVWDDDKSKWWFSVLDIVGVLRGGSDYGKNRNYWKYLKAKLKREGNDELVSRTNQLKLIASDGKKYQQHNITLSPSMILLLILPSHNHAKNKIYKTGQTAPV